MALSTAIFVGESKEWLPEIIERSRLLKVNGGESILNLIHVTSYQ